MSGGVDFFDYVSSEEFTKVLKILGGEVKKRYEKNNLRAIRNFVMDYYRNHYYGPRYVYDYLVPRIFYDLAVGIYVTFVSDLYYKLYGNFDDVIFVSVFINNGKIKLRFWDVKDSFYEDEYSTTCFVEYEENGQIYLKLVNCINDGDLLLFTRLYLGFLGKLLGKRIIIKAIKYEDRDPMFFRWFFNKESSSLILFSHVFNMPRFLELGNN